MERRTVPLRGSGSPRRPEDQAPATAQPRGLTARCLVAVSVFAAAVVPGWAVGDLIERVTGNPLLDWLTTCASCAAAIAVLGPRTSYRRRDAWLGAVPLLGWYLLALMSWRVALLPYRDWEPRADELWRARWLTGDLIGYWRCDTAAPPAQRRVRAWSAR